MGIQRNMCKYGIKKVISVKESMWNLTFKTKCTEKLLRVGMESLSSFLGVPKSLKIWHIVRPQLIKFVLNVFSSE